MAVDNYMDDVRNVSLSESQLMSESLASIENATDIGGIFSKEECQKINDIPTYGLDEGIRGYIGYMCKKHQVPTEFVLAPMIATMSAAAGVDVEVLSGPYKNTLNTWCVVIAPSGCNKSAPAKDILKPLRGINNTLYEQSERDRAEYERAKLHKGKDGMSEVLSQPKQLQILASNITDESRIKLLCDNPHGILQYNDELAVFITSIGKYTNGKSEEVGELLSLMDGDEVTVNRIGRERIHLKRPYLSLFGGIQPGIATKYLGTEGMYGSGFTPRLLIFEPKDVKAPRSRDYDGLDTYGYESKWSELVTCVYSMTKSNRCIISLDEESRMAHSTFVEAAADVWDRSKDECEKSVISKLRIYVWKLAAIAHLMNNAVQGTIGSISGNEMQWAVNMCRYIYGRHMSLVGRAGLSKSKPTIRDVVLAAIEAKPDVNLTKLADVFEIKPATARQIKHRGKGV